MADMSLFRDRNTAAVTSCENKDASKYQMVLICLEYARAIENAERPSRP